ncbi:M20 family metallopeptidase [Streptomyces sp. ODS28]|uniref:M20 metallopeptidase family protein n=1 Tax=Streptomyces sp. ODS28 TaxID=3136688 RepID=UPI0031F16AD6
MDLRDDAEGMREELTLLRRELHREPETGLQLPRTQEKVLAALQGLPLEISTGSALTSVTAVLRGGGPHTGGGPRPVVLLRGDMDALPVTEETGEEFTSRVEGVMHACGHDLHTAGLVGAARLLCAHRDQLPGDVVFMFQPGEEGHDGAGAMLEEGVLEAAGRTVDAAYGLHVFSSGCPADTFVSRPGPLMAAADGLFVRVEGKGGHGSKPHVALDPVPAACEMVTALQTLTTRRFDVFDPVVITVGEFHAGTQRNIIPDTARFNATVRSFSHEARERVRELALPLCHRIAEAHGLRAEVVFGGEQYPVTVNTPAEHEFAAETVREVFGEERFHHLADPLTGAEDFSRVLEKVPGAFVFLDAAYPDGREPAYNHSPRAAFDDRVLPDASALLAELAVRRLRR